MRVSRKSKNDQKWTNGPYIFHNLLNMWFFRIHLTFLFLRRFFQSNYFKTILTSAKAKNLKMHIFKETVLYSSKECQCEFLGVPYYPKWRIYIAKRWTILPQTWCGMMIEPFSPRLAKKRAILIFPRTAVNTGNSQEILGIPGKYWEIRFHAYRMIYGNTFMYAIIYIAGKKAI